MPVHPVPLSDAAFDAWCIQCRPLLLQRAAERAHPQDAPDLVNEAQMRAWSIRDRFDAASGYDGFVDWVCHQLRQVCAEWQATTARRRRHETALDTGDVPSAESLTQQVYAYLADCQREAAYALLERAGSLLTPKQELCLRLALDGLTHAQIAVYLAAKQPPSNTVPDPLPTSQRANVTQTIRRAETRLAVAAQADAYVGLLQMLYQEWREDKLSIYRKPAGVWDRDGMAGQIQKRRSVARQAAYDRRQEKQGGQG